MEARLHFSKTDQGGTGSKTALVFGETRKIPPEPLGGPGGIMTCGV
jgi:hypothetical protein